MYEIGKDLNRGSAAALAQGACLERAYRVKRWPQRAHPGWRLGCVARAALASAFATTFWVAVGLNGHRPAPAAPRR
jgi:hypothetical protein